jgi:ankyrin repeat protein
MFDMTGKILDTHNIKDGTEPMPDWHLQVTMRDLYLCKTDFPKRITGGLLFASMLGLSLVVQRLVEEGADVNEKYDVISHRISSEYALLAAIENGPNTETVEVLLKAGAVVSIDEALDRACSRSYVDVVKLLLEWGANAVRWWKEPTIWRAVSYSQVEMVQVLVDAGANVNIPHLGIDYAKTLLHHAAEKGNVAIVQLLL